MSVLDRDPASVDGEWRSRIGLVLQSCTMPAELTVRELVELYAGYYPHPRGAAATIELVGLADKRDARTNELSGGQLRRLDVALALIGDPELVFLDEPTTGFDPSARHHAWEVIANLRELGKTIFLTTHYMDEAQTLADHVAVIAAGKIVAEGTPATLGGRDRELQRHLVHAAARHERLRAAGGARGGSPLSENGRVHVSVREPARALHALTGWALGRGDELGDLTVGRPTLEDVYLRLTDGQEEQPRMTGASLFTHQFRSDLARFWRNPQSRYFTLLMPIVFLVIFATIFKGTTVVYGQRITITTFYVPGIMALGIISATFVNLTQTIVTQRESGEFKRLRGTPLPASIVIGSRAVVGVVVAVAMSALLLRDRQARLQRAHPPIDDARAGRGGRRRRRRLLLHRVRHLDAYRQRRSRRARRSTSPSCRCTSSPACSSPKPRSHGCCATSPRCSPSATSRRRCAARSRRRRGPASQARTCSSSPRGASSGCSSPRARSGGRRAGIEAHQVLVRTCVGADTRPDQTWVCCRRLAWNHRRHDQGSDSAARIGS